MKIVVLLILIFFFLALITGIWGVINAVVSKVRRINSSQKSHQIAYSPLASNEPPNDCVNAAAQTPAGNAQKSLRMLQDLQRMLKNGDLTQSEYDSIKRRIIEDIQSENVSA